MLLAIIGWMLSIPGLIGLLCLSTLFEHTGARGWAVFTGLVSAVIAYFIFKVSLMLILVGVVGYIIVGVLWSFYRYKRHISETLAYAQSRGDSYIGGAIRILAPQTMLPTITAWILIWPCSLLEHLIGDIIDIVVLLVRRVFKNVYHSIYESAISQLKR